MGGGVGGTCDVLRMKGQLHEWRSERGGPARCAGLGFGGGPEGLADAVGAARAEAGGGTDASGGGETVGGCEAFESALTVVLRIRRRWAGAGVRETAVVRGLLAQLREEKGAKAKVWVFLVPSCRWLGVYETVEAGRSVARKWTVRCGGSALVWDSARDEAFVLWRGRVVRGFTRGGVEQGMLPL